MAFRLGTSHTVLCARPPYHGAARPCRTAYHAGSCCQWYAPRRPWTSHLASDGANRRCSDGTRRAKATKRGGMGGEESACLIVCAGQRVAQEGSSPSGALVESTVSESGGHASLAVACGWRGGGQGVHREVESEGFEEQYRAVIEGAIP